jgi:hypothetical protein
MENKLNSENYSYDWRKNLELIVSVILIPIAIALFAEKIPDLGFLTVLFILVFFTIWVINLKTAKNDDELNKILADIPAEGRLIIPRTIFARGIAEKIQKSQKFLHIIVGSSGAGKSILINKYLEPELIKLYPGKNIHKIIVDSYDRFEYNLNEEIKKNNIAEFNGTLIETIKSINKENQLFIILDQFEKIFKIKERELAIEKLRVLCPLFKFCSENGETNKNNVVFIIVLRKESFFNLKFFEDYIPEIKDIHVLEGFPLGDSAENIEHQLKDSLSILLGENSNMINDVIKKCVQENKNDIYYMTSCQKINKKEKEKKDFLEKMILPVEVMTVAKSIKITRDYKGEPDHIDKNNEIRQFFEYYLKSYEENDAQKIFYALSVSPPSIRSLTAHEISSITNIPCERVKSVLNRHLKQKQEDSSKTEKNFLFVQPKDDYYDWKHDFFAEQFNEISGGILDPIDRDNINFFWSHKTILPKFNFSEDEKIVAKHNKNTNISWMLFIASVLLLFIRTLAPLIQKIIPSIWVNDWLSVSIINIQGLPNGWDNIDFSFLPIFINLSLWSWYVTSVYRKILTNLDEITIPERRRMSTFVAYWSFVNVILTIMAPFLWIFFTGLGGLFVGLKYRQLTLSIKTGLRIRFDEKLLKSFGNETIINSLIMMVFGAGYALLCEPIINKLFIWNPNESLVWIITLALFGGLTYFAIFSCNEHSSKKKVITFLGIAKRYRFIDDQQM